MSENILQTCEKEPEIEKYYYSKLRNEDNPQQLVNKLLDYIKQQCENDDTPIATAYQVVYRSNGPRKKEILGILANKMSEQVAKNVPSTEEKAAEEQAAKKAAEEQAAKNAAEEQAAKNAARKITGTKEERIADYEAAAEKAAAEKSWFPWRRRSKSGGNKTRKSKKGMSLCVKKTAKKCTRVRGCKVASGKKRTYCRKKKNHTQKSNKK